MEKSAENASPLWHRALERYGEELGRNEDHQTIHEVHSLDDLLNHMNTIQTTPSGYRQTLISMNRLAPKFKFVDDFSAIMALTFGVDATLTTIAWGTIRLILTLAVSAGDNLQDILDMFEELSLTLPRFRVYENTLPMSHQLEGALIDVYAEVICFYARTIHLFRDNPHVRFRLNAWERLLGDFSRTTMRINRLSSVVESEADLACMRLDEHKYKQVIELMDNFSTKSNEDNQHGAKYHQIPFLLNTKFSGRESLISTIARTLEPGKTSSNRLVALFGMGGIGKTQLALQYVHQSVKIYDVILWIAADNTITVGRSFQDAAQGLQLYEIPDDIQDSAAAIWKVKHWLSTTSTRWLIVFDNAGDLKALKTAWPTGPHGSILLTTRDFDVANIPAARCLHVEAFDDTEGSMMLLKQVGVNPTDASNKEHATVITQAFGGLPLALSQIGGFIAQRRLPLKDFIGLYERYTAEIDGRKTVQDDYEHTLSTVWDASFQKLPETAAMLLNLLVFLDPDGVDEEIFLQGSRTESLNPKFDFIAHYMDLNDAEQPLLQTALISKTMEQPVITVHRLIQSAALHRLPTLDRPRYFDVAIQLLSWGFPDTWSKDVDHQVSAWKRCEKCLPHIKHISKLYRKHDIRPTNLQQYAELLLSCSWYLYERETYDVAGNLVYDAIQTFEDKSILAFASALDLAGLIDLDLCRPSLALKPFTEALEIRKAQLGPDDPFVASSLNNIALAHTEMGNLEEAYATHQQATGIRLRANSDRIGNSYSNMASLLLRMGKPDEAEMMLTRCPSLKDFTDETFLSTGNPRFSGDMVLLSRIRLRQGRVDDALRLASKALAFRQKLMGNRLKTCDSLYDVACILYLQGHLVIAIDFLEQLVDISESLSEGGGQLARALYKLSVLYAEKGTAAESEACKSRAIEIRGRLRPEDKDAPFDEDSFSKLTLWML